MESIEKLIDIHLSDRNIFDLFISFSSTSDNNYLTDLLMDLEKIIQDVDSPNIAYHTMLLLSYAFEESRKQLNKRLEETDKELREIKFKGKENLGNISDILRNQASLLMYKYDFETAVKLIYPLYIILIQKTGKSTRSEIIEEIKKIKAYPPKDWLAPKSYLLHPSYEEFKANAEDLNIKDPKIEINGERKELINHGILNYIIEEELDDNTALLRFHFKDSEISVSEIGNFLNVIGEVFGNIDGCEVILSDWGKGSFWVKIKLIFNDLFAKEEAKKVFKTLEEGFEDTSELVGEAVEAKFHDKPISEVKKIDAEINKINQESEKLKAEVDSLRADEKANDLKHQERLIELERLRVQLDKEKEELKQTKLETKNKTIETYTRLSELFKLKILESNSFELEINNLLYLVNDGSDIYIYRSIDEILPLKEDDLDNLENED